MSFVLVVILALFLMLGEFINSKISADWKFIFGCIWGTLIFLIAGVVGVFGG
jgi:hypothetical protein